MGSPESRALHPPPPKSPQKGPVGPGYMPPQPFPVGFPVQDYMALDAALREAIFPSLDDAHSFKKRTTLMELDRFVLRFIRSGQASIAYENSNPYNR